jgi:DnaJ-class molecular chaperone
MSPQGNRPRAGRRTEAGRGTGSGGGNEADRSTCTPCRGSGHLISNLGGEQHEVVCPWCGGTGRFQPGRDAQQSPAERGA